MRGKAGHCRRAAGSAARDTTRESEAPAVVLAQTTSSAGRSNEATRGRASKRVGATARDPLPLATRTHASWSRSSAQALSRVQQCGCRRPSLSRARAGHAIIHPRAERGAIVALALGLPPPLRVSPSGFRSSASHSPASWCCASPRLEGEVLRHQIAARALRSSVLQGATTPRSVRAKHDSPEGRDRWLQPSSPQALAPCTACAPHEAAGEILLLARRPQLVPTLSPAASRRSIYSTNKDAPPHWVVADTSQSMRLRTQARALES